METPKPIRTDLEIPPELIPDFERVKSLEERPSTRNTVLRLFKLGLQRWGELHPNPPEAA